MTNLTPSSIVTEPDEILRILRITQDDNDEDVLTWERLTRIDDFTGAPVRGNIIRDGITDHSIEVLLVEQMWHNGRIHIKIDAKYHETLYEGSTVDYIAIHWDPMKYPYVHFTDAAFGYYDHPWDYLDFIYVLEATGHIDPFKHRTHHQSPVLKSVTTELQEMVDNVRRRYGKSICPTDPPPLFFLPHRRIKGGTHVQDRLTHEHYIARTDISSEKNYRLPMNSAAFRSFNSRLMEVPSSDLTVPGLSFGSGINNEHIWIDYGKNEVYIPYSDLLIETQLNAVPRFSFLSIVGSEIQYIGKINHRLPYFINQIEEGMLFRCDPHSKEAEFSTGDIIEVHLEQPAAAETEEEE